MAPTKTHPAPRLLEKKHRERLASAVASIILTAETAAYLEANDPQALKQGATAILNASEELGFNWSVQTPLFRVLLERAETAIKQGGSQ